MKVFFLQECKQEEQNWSESDTDCVLAGGSCQFTSSACNDPGKDLKFQFYTN